MSIARRLNFLLFCAILSVCVSQTLSCRRNGQYCQSNLECCSGKCMTYTYFCAPVMHSDADFNMLPPPFNRGGWRYKRNDNPVEVEVEVVTLPDDKSNTGNHAVERVDRVTSAPSVRPTSNTCKAIGLDCSESSECCSNRCHTYLHRCVT